MSHSLGRVVGGVLGSKFLEKQGAQGRPDTGIIPMLAEDISWIGFTTDVEEPCDASSDSLPDFVVGQRVVSLV